MLGEDHAYPMLSYGTMLASAAWKLYAKSQDVPFELANAVSEQIKRYELAVKHADEDEKDSIDARNYIDKQYWDIFEKSKEYRGLVTSWSIAPCSYLLYQGSIRKEIGLVRIKDHLCCCMDGHWAERCHFLKNDLLTVQVVNLIYQSFHRIGKEPPSVNELLDWCSKDDKPWELYKKGCTICLNQVEKKGTSARVGAYKPTNISELAAFVAAIRPGFKSEYKTFESRTPFAYGLKAFDDLIQTPEMPNSFVMYQEQEMEALHFAGIPMSECYTAIKNIAKKRKEKVLVYEDKFKKGFKEAAIREGKTEAEADELVTKLWQIIQDASSYSFNCVSGDTKIQRGSVGRHEFEPTIEEMFKIKNDKSYADRTGHRALHQKYKYRGYGTALSMCDDKRIRNNQIVDIYYSGKQDVYQVITQSGKSIKCTMNHSFPTPNGKKHLSELRIGDVLYCKGEYETDRTRYPFTDGSYKPNYPTKGQCGFRKNDLGVSVIYNNTRKEKIETRCCCEDCVAPFVEGLRFELHHVDFDRTNNSKDNYAWLCASCHKKRHYEHGRRVRYDKGIPTYADEIVSIEFVGNEDTYDIEMADPNHTFVSENGLVVSNCSHAYCVALDSLYEAWLKANHPLEFYEVALNLYEKKGDKDKMSALKEEAEHYFDILFPPLRFGQDNRALKADISSNSIMNSIGSIKGMSKGLASALYECGKVEHKSFFDVLKWLDERSIKSAKVSPLVKIDYFQQFGNNRELMRLVELFDFLDQGKASKIKKDKLDPIFESILKKYATDKGVKGNELKSYTITDMGGLLKELEEYTFSLHLEDLPYRVKAMNQNDVLGYVDLTTGKEEDRRKLYILDQFELKGKFNNGKPWKYVAQCKSVGSGKTSSLSISPYIYERNPFHKGDIVFAKTVRKDAKGYWQLVDYTVLPM